MPAETEMSTLDASSQPAAGKESPKKDGVEGPAEPNDDNNNNNDEDDDDITVIMLDQNTSNNNRNRPENAFAWIDSTSPEMEERRRNVLVQELRRVQRASFMHFALLCLIPTILLAIVVATVVGEEEDCESDASFCELEPRTFMNAFTTRVSLERKEHFRLDDRLVASSRAILPVQYQSSISPPPPCPNLPHSAFVMPFQLIGRTNKEWRRVEIEMLLLVFFYVYIFMSLALIVDTQFHDSTQCVDGSTIILNILLSSFPQSPGLVARCRDSTFRKIGVSW
jgi:hypothetical protein